MSDRQYADQELDTVEESRSARKPFGARPITLGDKEVVSCRSNRAGGTRLRVWDQQPDDFFDEAFLDADGTIAPSDGWCKQGVDISSNGIWDSHVLVVSLANTAEPLFLVNRSGNRPSHEQGYRTDCC